MHDIIICYLKTEIYTKILPQLAHEIFSNLMEFLLSQTFGRNCSFQC